MSDSLSASTIINFRGFKKVKFVASAFICGWNPRIFIRASINSHPEIYKLLFASFAKLAIQLVQKVCQTGKIFLPAATNHYFHKQFILCYQRDQFTQTLLRINKGAASCRCIQREHEIRSRAQHMQVSFIVLTVFMQTRCSRILRHVRNCIVCHPDSQKNRLRADLQRRQQTVCLNNKE